MALRIVLLTYGMWQDANLAVKYTDIDYHVFLDAARAILRGDSPYARATYRYTPLVAYLMVPGLAVDLPVLGKLVFVASDLVVAMLLRKWARTALSPVDAATVEKWTVLAWLWNPFVANMATRGSAEAVVCVLCVAVLYLVARDRIGWAAAVFGVAVHVKVYPIMAAVPLAIHVAQPAHRSGPWRPWRAIRCALIATAAFAALTAAMVAATGIDMLHHTYGYHVTRADHRHNFSVYFYAIYLNIAASSGGTAAIALVPFAAQVVTVTTLGVRFARTNLPLAVFLQTVAFVAFNKVMTSQYFMWWLCYVPMVVPALQTRSMRRVPWWVLPVLAVLWVAAQGAWLNYAYQLEFLGIPTFRALFVSSVALFAVHVALIVELIARAAANEGVQQKLE
ncbi:GPI mannosyltransferase 1 [Allomyces arbusculus]|nr:GPI mannosyltransferase 1 [Allomyces arbusculus]